MKQDNNHRQDHQQNYQNPYQQHLNKVVTQNDVHANGTMNKFIQNMPHAEEINKSRSSHIMTIQNSSHAGSAGKFDSQQHHQTTSKKIPLDHKKGFDQIQTRPVPGMGDSSSSNMMQIKGSQQELKAKKRDSSQQPLAQQMRSIRDGQSHSLENLSNYHVKSNLPPKHFAGQSDISTNPSSSQQIFRQHAEIDTQKPPQFIQLKHALSSQNQTTVQKKQLLVLNQKLIANNHNSANKESMVQKANEEDQNMVVNENGTLPMQIMSSSNPQQVQNQIHQKQKIDKIKNIYSQYNNNKTSQAEVNNYADLGIKGLKTSNSRQINQKHYIASRNSQLSNQSSSVMQTAQDKIDNIAVTYGIPTQNFLQHQSKSQNSTHYKQGINRSHNDSGKNSYNNTKTSSFGIKQSTSQQEVPLMEVRGHSHQAAMNNSNYNKFIKVNKGKQGGAHLQMTNQHGPQSNVQLSKHKSSKVVTNAKDVFTHNSHSRISQNRQQDSNQQQYDNKRTSASNFQKSRQSFKDSEMTESITKNLNKNFGNQSNINTRNDANTDLMLNINNYKNKINKSESKNLQSIEPMKRYVPLTQAENTMVTQPLGGLKNRKSENVCHTVNQRSTLNINLKSDLNKKQGSISASQLKKIGQSSVQNMNMRGLQRGPKPENLQGDESQLPQINGTKSEASIWNKKKLQQSNERRASKMTVIQNIDQDSNSQMSSKKFLNMVNNMNVNSASKSSIQNGPQDIFDSQSSHVKTFNEFQQANVINNKSFDNSRELYEKQGHKLSVKKQRKLPTEQEERSIDNENMHRMASNSSLEQMRPDTKHRSVDRKTRLKNLNKKSMEQNPLNEQEMSGLSIKHNGIQLAPLPGVREGFGVGPGTANTQGAPNRNVYNNHNKQMGNVLQYKLSSQQCNSEMYQHQMSYPMANSNNQSSNKYMIQNEGFDNLFNPNFENLDALDPKDDIDDNLNIQNIPIIRNQKSQGTYRQNHQKIDQIMHNKFQFHDNNHSLSEMYDRQSQSNVNEVNSQINDIHINITSQMSQNSENANTSKMVAQNHDQLSRQEDRPHPFNGPKLHLFKKGQSKSSQMKSRKIKTSDNKGQRMTEMQSQQQYQMNDGMNMSSVHPSYPQRQQFSEGGPANKSFNTFKKVSKTKNGHINISEILQGNRHNGILANNIAPQKLEKMYTDNRSQNSQGIISQSSYEINQGTPNDQNHNISDLQHQIDIDNHSRGNEVKSNLEPNQMLPSQSFNNRLYNNQPVDLSEIIAFETRSQQCPSQMSTLQHNVNEDSVDSKFNLPMVSASKQSNALQNEPHITSPYVINQIALQNDMHNKNSLQQESSQKSMINGGDSSTRPNTTNHTANHIYIEDKQLSAANIPKHKSINRTPQQFQHPKVGKNSKHPQVFKQQSTNSKNNSILLQQYQNNNKSPSPVSTPQQQIFGGIGSGSEQNYSTSNIRKYSTDKPEKTLEPSQTGDFPTPQQIVQYSKEFKQEKQQINEQQDKIDNDPQSSDEETKQLLQFNEDQKTKQMSEKDLMDINQSNLSKMISKEESTNEQFASLISNDQKDNVLERQNSEALAAQYYTPQIEQKDLSVQHQSSAPMRNFKSRQSNARPKISQNRFSDKSGDAQGQKEYTEQTIKQSQKKTSAATSAQQKAGSTQLQKQATQSSSPKMPAKLALQPTVQVAEAEHTFTSKDLEKHRSTINSKKQKTIEAKGTSQTHDKDKIIQAGKVPAPTTPQQKKHLGNAESNFNLRESLNQANGLKSSLAQDSHDSNYYQLSNRNEKDKDSMRETNQVHFHSIAQTPCFAETPNTTDQFKNYKIVPEPILIPTMLQTGFSNNNSHQSAYQQPNDEDQHDQDEEALSNVSNKIIEVTSVKDN